MGYLLENPNSEGPGWVSYFNYVIVDSQKPAFFGEGTVLRFANLENIQKSR